MTSLNPGQMPCAGRGCGHFARPLAAASAALAFALLASACGHSGGPPPPPRPAVTVMRPISRLETDWQVFSGRLQSPLSTSIQARVSGLITETPFKEGALVHQGDVLFVIDDSPFKADLDNKKATVAKDEAQVALTEAQLVRSQRLLQTHVIDQQDYDTALANAQQAKAQVAADAAALEASALNLEWTRVIAPITGVVSKINVTIGNLITGGVGNGTALTSLVSIDPIYCYVPVPERLIFPYAAFIRERHETVRDAKIPCALQLENESDFPHKGVIDFVDNSVDPATGTIQVRGVFPNADAYLKPGLFARMQVAGSPPYQALLVPDEAIQTDQNEKYLLVTDSNGIVQAKPVTLGRLFGTLRAIDNGISPDDEVIVNGLQMARPGAAVNAQQAPSPAATGTAQ